MVRIIYGCEICHRRYDSLEDAEECEGRSPPIEYPIGMLIGEHDGTGMYSHITFAVAENKVIDHDNYFLTWVCRDHKGGPNDSLGDERCTYRGGIAAARLDPNHLSFKRMVKYLRGRGIEPTVWDGKKAIPLAVYLKALAEMGR